MSKVKLFLFFLLIAGNVVLLVNWNSIFSLNSKVVSNRELTLQDSLTIFWDLKRECDQCRADILDLVRKRNISGCRSHSGWEKYLSSNERTQVESLLCLNKHSSEAKRRIQEYLNGKQFNSWKDVKDANNQVANILKQYEKDREIGRSEMLNLVRKACWYGNDDYYMMGYKRFEYFREHSGWKFLSQEEHYAVEAIYRVLKGKIRYRKDIRSLLRDKEIHSWEDVMDIRKEIVKHESLEEERINKENAKSEKDASRAKAKAEILELVKKKQLNECRSHPGWNKLTNEEQFAVEAILNLNHYRGSDRIRVKKMVNDMEINSWEDIMKLRRELMKLHLK